jgi:hypothetical protein
MGSPDAPKPSVARRVGAFAALVGFYLIPAWAIVAILAWAAWHEGSGSAFRYVGF